MKNARPSCILSFTFPHCNDISSTIHASSLHLSIFALDSPHLALRQVYVSEILTSTNPRYPCAIQSTYASDKSVLLHNYFHCMKLFNIFQYCSTYASIVWSSGSCLSEMLAAAAAASMQPLDATSCQYH